MFSDTALLMSMEDGPIRELAQQVDGKNERKLDLETFAISAMFDRVLGAAKDKAILKRRERIKRETIETRRLHHRHRAA